MAIIGPDFDLNLISPHFFHSPYLYKYPLSSALLRKLMGSEPLQTDKRGSSNWRESTVFNDTEVEVGWHWHTCQSLTADGMKSTKNVDMY